MSFIDALNAGRLYVDGGLGTLLQDKGLGAGEPPARWNIEHPEHVIAAHQAYLKAGCDIITANTFGIGALSQPVVWRNWIQAGVRIARQAVQAAGHGYVALDLGPTGRLLKPFGDLEFEDAVQDYAQIAREGAACGADLILIETMTDLIEMRAAVLGCTEACALPVIASMSPSDQGRMLTGADVRGMVAMLEGLHVCAIGLNCGLGPKQMESALREAFKAAHVPLLVSPNAGLPIISNGRTTFPLSPDDFARDMRALAQEGARLLGGCCGTTPAHIAALRASCADIPVSEPQGDLHCVICSYARTLTLGDAPVLIGERINPTGKPVFKQALRSNDLAYAAREAVLQQEAGAEALDINTGLPDVDEVSLLPRTVQAVQAVCDLPLQLDSANPEALEAVLRVYAGKALVNSVNGKESSMRAVFPLVKKYGGAIVALTLDENGIPDNVQGRVDIARRILERAKDYGLTKRDFLFDALTLAVSSDPRAANTTLDTVRALKDDLGVLTVLGASNVSFGLPRREAINRAFLAMAVQAGLDAAIINPCQNGMTETLRAAAVLTGRDARCERYIALCEREPSVAPEPAHAMTLEGAILKGLAEDAARAADAAMDGGSPVMNVIQQNIVPALTKIGEAFEAGRAYLPQLLTAADAARAAFDRVRARMAVLGDQDVPRGIIILATVRGDIHDIGKNIVKALLESHHFRVIDLGRDVEPMHIMDAVRESGASAVGLSALMTTTVPSMRETVALIKKHAPETRVVVGGAVLTQALADDMGADFYAPDAMVTVRFAQRVYPEM